MIIIINYYIITSQKQKVNTPEPDTQKFFTGFRPIPQKLLKNPPQCDKIQNTFMLFTILQKNREMSQTAVMKHWKNAGRMKMQSEVRK